MKFVRIASLSALVQLIGCNVTMTEQRAVEIPGQSAEQRMSLALRIVEMVQPGLGSKIRKRFPGATPEQLAGLRIGPSRFLGRQLGVGTNETFDRIYVRCAITLERTDPTSEPILDFCEDLVKAELKHQQPQHGRGRADRESSDIPASPYSSSEAAPAPPETFCDSAEVLAALDIYLTVLADSQEQVGEVADAFKAVFAAAEANRSIAEPVRIALAENADLPRAAVAIRRISPPTPALRSLHAAFLDYARALDRAAASYAESDPADRAYAPFDAALTDAVEKEAAVVDAFPCLQ